VGTQQGSVNKFIGAEK